MKKLLSLLLLSLWATTGNAQFFNDGRDLSSTIAQATDPNLNLNVGIVAYYALNDPGGQLLNGCKDYSVNHYDLTATATLVPSSSGGTGNITPVANFDAQSGDNTRGFCFTGSSINFSADQQWSACAWVAVTNSVNNTPLIDNWGSSGNYLGFDSSGAFTVFMHDSGNNAQHVSGITPTLNTWYFIAGGWDGSVIWLSVNAGSRTTTSLATSHATTDTQAVGRYSSGVAPSTCSRTASIPPDCALGGCGYWARSLSTSEVTQLYNGASGLSPIVDGPF